MLRSVQYARVTGPRAKETFTRGTSNYDKKALLPQTNCPKKYCLVNSDAPEED